MADAEARAQEAKVAYKVRHAIQKVRVCNPDNHDELRQAVHDALSSCEAELGTLEDQVKNEVEKGLDVAEKRVERILEERQKEAEKLARPNELIKEMSDMLDEFKEKAEAYKAAAADTDAAGASTETFEIQLKEFTAKLKEFAASKAPEMASSKLPADVKKSWVSKVHEVSTASKEAQAEIDRVKKSVEAAKDAKRKELLETTKASLTEQIEKGPGTEAVGKAAEAVKAAEEKVEPLRRPKGKPESEMQALATEMDAVAEAALSSVSSARSMLKPVDGDSVDESIKEEIQAFITTETKKQTIRLGQLERRVGRIKNFIMYYRADVRKLRCAAKVAELKDGLLEKVKALSQEELVEQPTGPVKEAETEAEAGKKYATMAVEELEEIITKITAKAEAGKDAIADVRKQLCPLDDSIEAEDDDVKKALRVVVAKEVKSSETKLQLLDQRLAKVDKQVALYKAEVSKKKAAKVAAAKERAVKIAQVVKQGEIDKGNESFSREDMFSLFDSNKDGKVDEEEFLSFFEDSENRLSWKDTTEKEKELKAPSAEELRELFASVLKEGETSLDIDDLMRLVGAYMQVIRGTSLTEGLTIKSEAIRDLKFGEMVEVLAGPEQEESIKVKRVRVRTMTDGKEGWATVAGNAGTAFLKDAKLK